LEETDGDHCGRVIYPEAIRWGVMEGDAGEPLPSVDLDWLQTHLASLRRELAAKPDAQLRKAAKVAIVAAEDAVEEDDLRLAALQYTAASLLIDLAKAKVTSSS
jgi:hypothetical protein